ncbi:acid-activated periplasmic chaperone HdeA [Microbulbifer epialgicus]|uniref:Acid-activated periplasmic chaperone HdeA n=1 Tax=Microbulbifer epialgicus TaxID=393907 RepID=A0ABV4P1I3_9GAMM
MKSKQYILPLVIASLAASAAFADSHSKKPAKDWTCADFLAIDDEFKPKAVYWATGYAKGGKEDAAVMDVEGTEKVTPMIITACTQAPKESFWAKFKGEWHKMGRHHDKDKANKKMNMQGGTSSGTNNPGNTQQKQKQKQ